MSASNKALLDRLLEPVSRCFTADAARKLVQLRAAAEDQARIEELAERCVEGRLTPAEKAEYETYVVASNFIAVLQSKARKQLTRKRTAS